MRRWWWLLAAPLFLWPLLQWGAWLYTDWLWFQTVGYESVLLRVWSAKILLFVVGAGAGVLLFGLNLRAVGREEQPEDLAVFPTWQRALLERVERWRLGLALGCGLLAGIGVQTLWEEWLLFRHAVAFDRPDPILGRDAGFYLFRLPLLEGIYGALLVGLFLNLALAAVLYVAQRALQSWSDVERLSDRARVHLSLLGALLLLVRAWGYWLDRYDLLTHSSGAVYGAGYTDVHVVLPVLWLLMGIAVLGAAALLINLRLRRIVWLLAPLGLWILVSLVGGRLLPNLYQRLAVIPNEIERETPYLRHNIDFTRFAFGLDEMAESLFEVEESLSPEVIAAHRETIDNIRLWDERPLLPTFAQLQEIRPYYVFQAVDNDRYQFQGRYRQVALSAREMDASLVPGAKTWVNQHLIYTHGYGVCVAPVNEANDQGLPRFFVQDIPPISRVGLEIGEPSIYYGERLSGYVVAPVEASETTREFHYPAGEENRYTRYAGRGGVPVAGVLRRLWFGIRFRTINLLLTDAIARDSRILFYRNIVRRAQRLAPFLVFDHDPYLVIREDGGLSWVLDAYTVSRSFPYSEPFLYREPFLERDLPPGRRLPPRGINYIRNAVKVVVDAYHGDVAFYTSDARDPVLATYRRIFPRLFRPTDEMPEWLRQHRRYPQDLFLTQALVYRRYHMTEPQVFYNQEDMWSLPKERYADDEQFMMPYYIAMRLPDEEREEFLLMLPFTPVGSEQNPKHNLIAWMAAGCDGERYGEVTVFRFPKRKLIYGPMQVEARINQDPFISAQLTLWQQKGSKVERGNLLVIPIQGALLYVEPLYLRAEDQPLPELKRVIVAYGNRLVMEPTLDRALEALFEEGRREGSELVLAEWQSVGDRVQRALDLYRGAQQALRAGDYQRYGAVMAELEEGLTALQGDFEPGPAVPGDLQAPSGSEAPGGDATAAATP